MMTDKFGLIGVLFVVYKECREDTNALWEKLRSKGCRCDDKVMNTVWGGGILE